MQNQQTQQNPQNGARPFIPMGQGPNNFDSYQIGTENNPDVPDPNTPARQGSEISSQIGGAAIGGTTVGGVAIDGAVIGEATINGVATDASQTESPIPGTQESLDTQTLPNAIDDGIQENISNPEAGGVNTEATNIIPFPSQESQSSKDEQNTNDQTQTDGLPHMVLDNVGDSLSKENQEFVKKLMEDASENPFEFYQKATEAREKYSERIRGDAA